MFLVCFLSSWSISVITSNPFEVAGGGEGAGAFFCALLRLFNLCSFLLIIPDFLLFVLLSRLTGVGAAILFCQFMHYRMSPQFFNFFFNPLLMEFIWK